jgi:hypothetical protein
VSVHIVPAETVSKGIVSVHIVPSETVSNGIVSVHIVPHIVSAETVSSSVFILFLLRQFLVRLYPFILSLSDSAHIVHAQMTCPLMVPAQSLSAQTVLDHIIGFAQIVPVTCPHCDHRYRNSFYPELGTRALILAR